MAVVNAYFGASEEEQKLAVRSRLEAMRESVTSRIDDLAQDLNHSEEPLPADFAEQALELENEEAQLAVSNELAQELLDIDRALQQLESGTYGVCRKCSETIFGGRLAALPQATLCVACAELEKGDNR